MKKEKIGLTTTNWILSILGIILFSCFIILPPVFRVVFKEEAKTPEEETVYPNITTICYKDKISGIEYIDNEKISFQHQNSKIKQITKEISRKYNDPLIYQQKKQSYGVLVTAFSIISGYSYSITPNDNDANIICLSEKLSTDEAYSLVKKFIETPFSSEERHHRRIEKIAKYEDSHEC